MADENRNYWSAPRKISGTPASSNYPPPPGSSVVSHYKLPAGMEKDKKSVAVPQLEELKKKLSFIDNIQIKRQTRQQIRERYSEVVAAMLDSQVEVIRFQLTVNESDTKKRILADSLAESGRIDAEIKKISKEFDRDMLSDQIDAELEMLELKAAQIRQLNALMARNQDVLTTNDYLEHRKEIDEAEHQFRENIKGKTALLMINHAEKIQRALALFQERNFGGHPL